jgi:hypothetical protein
MGAEFVTAQGVFHDLERNVAITYEVQRRIVDKEGHRYSADMVGREGVQDVTIDDLVILNGFLTAIKDGDGSPESIFAEEAPQSSATLDAINSKVRGNGKPDADRQQPPTHPDAPAEQERPTQTPKDIPSRARNATADGEFAPSYEYASKQIKTAVAAKDADKLADAESLIPHVADIAHQAQLRREMLDAKKEVA